MEFEQIGKYKILAEIGQGAMGVVYKAHDPILNRYVAIKTISASLGSDDDLRKRFHREAQAAARLNHPNIITVFDFGEEHGKIYMAMELLEGTDLKDVMAAGTLATLDDKLAVTEQILDGLAFAHGKEVVHRDLKPGNIHIQPNGQIKIMDFGLARLGSSEMTQAGVVMGTPNYMSPEQVLGEKVDSRSDIFAMGAVFYELLTSHKPFEAESMHGVLFQVVHKEPQPARKWAPDLPPVLVQVVEKCLVKDKNKRFQHAGEMREAVVLARQALAAGRVHEATLDMESGKVFFDAEEFIDDGSGASPRSWPPQPGDQPVVDGTVALDQHPLEGVLDEPAASKSHPTLSGRSRTQVNRQATQRPLPRALPVDEGRSRKPLFIGGGVAAAVAIGLGVWFMTRPVFDATFNLLLNSEMRNVRRDLDGKNYKDAIDGAQKILDLADLEKRKSSNPIALRTIAEVRQVLDDARNSLTQIEDAATGAEDAFNAGDLEKASTKLSELIQLNPKHEVATKLLPQLNTQFKSKAEDARQAMASSKAGAERLEGASGAADFAKAQKLAADADRALRQEEYAVATRAFLESRDTFDTVRRAIETKLAEEAKGNLAKAQKLAEDSRKAMSDVRTGVEKLQGVQSLPDFNRAQDLAKQAEDNFAKGNFAEANQAFLDSRNYFSRAKNALEAKLAAERIAAEKAATDKASAERAAAEKAAADKAASEKAALERAAAEKAAAEKAAAEKAAAEKAAAATSQLPGPTGPVAPVQPPLPPPIGRLDPGAESQMGKGAFLGVATEFKGKIEFDAPKDVRAGEGYSIKVYFTNEGSKSAKLRDVSINTRMNAQGTPRKVKPLTGSADPGQKVLVAEITGAWPTDGLRSWVTTVDVYSDKEEYCEAKIAFRK